MKERKTFLLPKGSGVDPKNIRIDSDHLAYHQANSAAEESRITVDLAQLPSEIQTFLNDFHELHIRNVSPRNQPVYSPIVSRLPPGLHAFFTPRSPNGETTLCPTLKKTFGDDIKCLNSSASFSKPPVLSERFAASSTYQFHHFSDSWPSLSPPLSHDAWNLVEVSGDFEKLCYLILAAGDAAHIDYDFDVISHTVTVTIFRSAIQVTKDSRNAAFVEKQSDSWGLEVGILSPEEPDEPEELKMGGYLTVVGEADHASPTMFSFPSRHHPLPPNDHTTFTTRFEQPTGLHPKLSISLPRATLRQPKASCALHAYFTLPSSIFIDRYQLSDPLFLASQNLIALRALSGSQDLEAPDWAEPLWGSAALFELAHPNESSTTDSEWWNITVPTHLRYLKSNASLTPLAVPWPVVFWACEAEEGLKMATNPFDRVNLGYDGLFGPKTMFYHVPPRAEVERLVEVLQVPTLDAQNSAWVSAATALVVLVGFGWVCWRLLVSQDRGGVNQEKKDK